MLNRDGFPTQEQVKDCFPSETVLINTKAIIGCYERIPCNPCETSCPFEAIHIGEDINNIPKVDFDKCTGCSICVYSCPGLAITTVQLLDNNVRFRIPYEFVPYPVVDEVWLALNRKGEVIGEAKIEKVSLSKRQDKTAIIQVLVDKKHLYDFITIRRNT